MKWKFITAQIIAILFILLWMYAATSKLMDYEKFQVQLGKSPMLTRFSGITAWVVPASEIVISLLLFTERFRLIGLYASFCLIGAFTAYIFAITHYSEVIPCSCGGILENMTWQQHFYFNIVFQILAMVGILFRDSKYWETYSDTAMAKGLFE